MFNKSIPNRCQAKVGERMFAGSIGFAAQANAWMLGLMAFVSFCFLPTPSCAQFLELRSSFERFTDYRVVFGGSGSTPPNSQWDDYTHSSYAVTKKQINFDQYVSIEYMNFRFGFSFFSLKSNFLPYLYWNPQFHIGSFGIGGDSSRFALSLRLENILAKGDANEFLGDGQSDKSRYPDRNSFSFVISYWMGRKLDTNDFAKLIREAAYDDSRREDAVMGPVLPGSGGEVRYSTRNGFSVGIGLGTGKYAGSGPISRHLNFLNTYSPYLDQGFSGFNPLLLLRYRLRNLIAQFDVAGDDVNFGIVLRNMRRLDIETGLIHLEHIPPRSTRGPHRPEAYLGLRYALGGGENSGSFEYGDEVLNELADSDGDGLTDLEEVMIYHTDPHNPDTDGDGLKDGDEVRLYNTNPNNKDTDGDGINDGDEVKKYHTSPRLVDTDGDGLSDGDEINKYKTNPLKVDTDGDGLTDGEEVNKYKTDPIKSDTDGDGLTDGEEVTKYHTNPLLRDTDGDTLDDGYEVNVLHSDPLSKDTDGDGVPDDKDDCPDEPGPASNHGCPDKPFIVGQRIDLPKIEFETGKWDILPQSVPALNQLLDLMNKYPSTRISIQGHTDNAGDSLANEELSLNRARSVVKWLVDKSINPSRMEARGYGQSRPITTNSTPEGREANRRIEFIIIQNDEK